MKEGAGFIAISRKVNLGIDRFHGSDRDGWARGWAEDSEVKTAKTTKTRRNGQIMISLPFPRSLNEIGDHLNSVSELWRMGMMNALIKKLVRKPK
ncbi:hypothetical protein AVEN_82376-1 [Araneus ventricosus]|uniref:Uncharacterized protein n=1 Tax=Araneus ventricosus TaxID=182803 RepID=A0A4Y2HIV2_ARAVE|nr:hypothetical protein AVEN_82376-1 [Araneus ventricosus]